MGSAQDPRETTQKTVQLLTAQLERLQRDPKVTPREISQVSQAVIAATRLFAKVAGVLELTEAQVVRSPAWRNMMAVVVEALRPFPDASGAVAAALRKVEGV